MIACRASTVATAVLALCVLAGAAVAQGEPRRLFDPNAQMPAAVTPVATEASPGAVPPGAVPADDSIRVERLGQIDPDAVGLLRAGEGGLPLEMWSGTSRAFVAGVLSRLPDVPAAPSLRELQRRLLLTTAKPPGGPAAEPGLVALRARLLVAMGESEDAAKLVGAATGTRSGATARAVAEGHLLRYDFAAACNEVDAQATTGTDAFWQKTLVFCQALQGRKAEVQFGLDLLREQGALNDDALFLDLVEALAARQKATTKATGEASPLNLATLRAAGVEVPQWLADKATPAMQRAIAGSTNAPREMRLAAARAAGRAGTLSPAALRDLYGALGIGRDDALAALAAGAKPSPGLVLAAGWMVASQQTVPAAQAEALRRGWTLARTNGDGALAAMLAEPLLVRIEPGPNLAWFAGEAARAALLAGRTERAREWLRIAAGVAARDEAATAAVTDLWPLIRLAGDPEREGAASTAAPAPFDLRVAGTGALASQPTPLPAAPSVDPLFGWTDARLDRWLAARYKADPAVAARQRGVLLALFAALGEPVGPERWREAAAAAARAPATAPVAMPDSAMWFAMDEAALAGRGGETVLLALALLAEGELGTASPVVLHRVVADLAAVDLHAEARRIAVEAALAAGL
ncbi:MAG: hypothetical protein EXQ97_04815 [Alphaproteobacteria bacterium]|nr:hypothetical protein [Alphaproteobacteria bacterium]